MKKILNTQTKLLRLFRPQQSPAIEATAPVNPTEGPRTAQELIDFHQFVDDAINAKRLAGQTLDPAQ